ncbi:hypothetical protein [Reichenbachiella versicolor]|uniref:hypothetical protein n=1 Tax=Reichenbachiella versicolor TaxID=1821036 RepID=UPI000D6E10A0|nr:hypothetical protein [Reichenbachiella versicolor]
MKNRIVKVKPTPSNWETTCDKGLEVSVKYKLSEDGKACLRIKGQMDCELVDAIDGEVCVSAPEAKGKNYGKVTIKASFECKDTFEGSTIEYEVVLRNKRGDQVHKYESPAGYISC